MTLVRWARQWLATVDSASEGQFRRILKGREERQRYRDRGPVVLSGVSGVSCASEALSLHRQEDREEGHDGWVRKAGHPPPPAARQTG